MNFKFDYSYGQNKVLSVLEKINHSQNIPHAFLFSGLKGTGKHFVAINFAKLINASINNDKLLDKIQTLSEPYIKMIFPLPRGKGETQGDSATAKLSKDTLDEIHNQIKLKSENPYYKINIDNASNIKISSIRDIKKFISLDYSDINNRVIIISDAHLMNDEAQNALLKSLEEPPDGVIFILLTDQKDNLLDTIRSRCWNINFEPLFDNEVKKILVDYFNVESDTAAKASMFADGSVENALVLIENDIDEILDQTIQVLRYALARKFNSAQKYLAEFIAPNPKLRLKMLIDFINKWLSDVVRNRLSDEKLYFQNYADTIIKFNEKFSEVSVTDVLSINENLISLIRKNVSLKLISMNIIFELASISKR